MDLTVVHVAETSNSDDEFQLDADFAAMKISPLKTLGIVSWDTKVYIRSSSQKKEFVSSLNEVYKATIFILFSLDERQH